MNNEYLKIEKIYISKLHAIVTYLHIVLTAGNILMCNKKRITTYVICGRSYIQI